LGDRFGHVPNNGAIRPYTPSDRRCHAAGGAVQQPRAEAGFSSRIVWLQTKANPDLRCACKTPAHHDDKAFSSRIQIRALCTNFYRAYKILWSSLISEERAFSGHQHHALSHLILPEPVRPISPLTNNADAIVQCFTLYHHEEMKAAHASHEIKA
jgi:hypothetical protein